MDATLILKTVNETNAQEMILKRKIHTTVYIKLIFFVCMSIKVQDLEPLRIHLFFPFSMQVERRGKARGPFFNENGIFFYFLGEYLLLIDLRVRIPIQI